MLDEKNYQLQGQWHLTLEDEHASMLEVVANDLLDQRSPQKGFALGLLGEMGAGKTHFTRELLEYLGYNAPVPSPTYTLVEQHRTKHLDILHIDLYRLERRVELESLAIEDYLQEPNKLLIIEWPKFNLIEEWQMERICQISVSSNNSRTYQWFSRV